MVGCSGKAQENQKCTVGLSNAPEVRGLRLGMSVDEFKTRFPVTTRETLYSVNPTVVVPGVPGPDRFGVINMPAKALGILSEAEVANNPQLKDVEIRQALFVDGRLAHFRIVYQDDKAKWENLAQFAVKTSESLGFPLEAWEPKKDAAKSFLSSEYDYDLDVGGYSNPELYLICDDITVVSGFLNIRRHDGSRIPFLQMDDLKAMRAMAKRENAWEAEEKKRKEREEEERREALKP